MNIHQNTANEAMPEKGDALPSCITTHTTLPENREMIHEAKITTPQPYGIFALCKIIEHLQTN
jgi:hypothetical protein